MTKQQLLYTTIIRLARPHRGTDNHPSVPLLSMVAIGETVKKFKRNNVDLRKKPPSRLVEIQSFQLLSKVRQHQRLNRHIFTPGHTNSVEIKVVPPQCHTRVVLIPSLYLMTVLTYYYHVLALASSSKVLQSYLFRANFRHSVTLRLRRSDSTAFFHLPLSLPLLLVPSGW